MLVPYLLVTQLTTMMQKHFLKSSHSACAVGIIFSYVTIRSFCFVNWSLRLFVTSIIMNNMDTFAFVDFFSIHTCPIPTSIPQTTLYMCIYIFFRVSTLWRVGGGRTAIKFPKHALFCEGNQKLKKIMNTALLSQRLFCQLVFVIFLNSGFHDDYVFSIFSIFFSNLVSTIQKWTFVTFEQRFCYSHTWSCPVVAYRCYEKLYCVTFKRDILEASREFVVCLF